MAIMAIHPVPPNQVRTAEAILRVVSEPADLSNADAPDLAPADAAPETAETLGWNLWFLVG